MSSPVPLRPKNESPVEQVRRLEAEARQIARQAAEALVTDLTAVASRCAEISDLTSLPPGVRDLLPRIGQQIDDAIEQLRAIEARAS